MTINLKTALRDLRREIDENRPKEAEKWVDIITGYFDDSTLTAPQIELAIKGILSTTDGSLVILLKCMHQPGKELRKVTIALLKLYLQLLKDHTKKVEPYATGLNAAAKQVVKSENSKAVEKELSIQIIRDMIDRKILPDAQFSSLLTELMGLLTLKLTDRFARKLFQTVGVIFRNEPEHATSQQALHFRGSMLAILENFLDKGNLISFLAASGAMDGLNYCFANYPPDTSTEPQVIARVYKIVKKFSPHREMERNISESALRLFKAHAPLFGPFILADAREWHRMFIDWFQSIKPEEKEFVVPAVYAFYGQVAATMIEDVTMNKEKKRQLLELFLGHFKAALLDANSKPFEIRLAILSFGILSGTVKLFLPRDAVTDLVNIVIANTNFAYFSELADKRDKIEHLPDFIQALSLLIEHMDGITSVQLASLEKFIQALLQDFQYLAAYHHPLVIRSLIYTFHACSKLGGTILEELMSRVMLQGIAWACSQKLPMDTYQDELDWKQNITFRNYLPLWRGLVNKIDYCAIPQQTVKILIGDMFFKCLLMIIKKLDLSTKKRKFLDKDGTESELFFCDPDSDLEPQKASDFQIFFNLVSFYQEVLSVAKKEDLKRHIPSWFAVIVREIILKSYEYPLVSGFMKLMELFLKLGYRCVDSIEELFAENDLKQNLFEYFKVVIAKAKGASGELQLTSLKLVFKAPDGIIQELIEELPDVLEMGFSIGKSVLWLAESALTCLERNVGKCDENNKDKLLRRVLPLFDNFLLSKSDLNMDFAEKEDSAKFKSTKKRLRLIVAPIEVTEEDRDLKRVQKRIILFLGTLEPDQCLYLIDSRANLENLTKWDINRNIKLPIYCNDKDIQPELLLDTLMPRVFHLARTAADRQTKVAACELVHGIILYVIRSGEMNCRRFWSEIYRAMIELACDSDTAVQQIFEPLLVQVMHFKSLPAQWSNTKGGNDLLLEVIMDCLCDKKDPGLRDMAAKALRELLSWTMEQTMDRNLVSAIVRDIIYRINFNSVDYNMERRLGAALAFNNIYRILRMSDRIIEKYWLMFLYSFSTSLWLCDEGDRVYGVDMLAEQVENSLDHVLRVIVERPQLLKYGNEERMKPEAFKEANLSGAIDYVFGLTASTNPRIRSKSQSMFQKMCVQNYSDVDSYLKEKHTVGSLRTFCEGKLLSLDMVDWTNAEEATDFLQSLLGTIGMYCFLFGDCQLNGALRKDILDDSVIFRDIRRFLDLCENELLDEEFSLKTKLMINQLAGKIIEDMFRLLIVLSQEETTEFGSFLQNNETKLISLVMVICFEDHQRTLPINHRQVRKRIGEWFEVMRNTPWAHSFAVVALRSLKQRVDRELDEVQATLETVLNRELITKAETKKIHGMLVAKRFILDNLQIAEDLAQFDGELKSRGFQLATILFGCCKETLHSFVVKAEVREYVNLTIRFCLEGNYNRETVKFVITSITSEDQVNLTNEKRTATVGQLFRNIFRDPVFEYFISAHNVNNDQRLFQQLFDKANFDNVGEILNILIDLTEFIFKYRGERVAVREYVSKCLIAGWPKMLALVSEREDSAVLIKEFVSHIGLISPTELYEVGEKLPGFDVWLCKELANPQSSSDVKCQIISLLPIITGPNQSDQRTLDRALFTFKSYNIPLESNEFKANSLERAKFGVLIKTILDTLKISKSVTLFKFLIGITVPEKTHMMESEVRKTVSELIASLDTELQLKFLNVAVDIFQDAEDPPEPLVRLNLFRRFIKTILRACDKETVLSFYKSKMRDVYDMITAHYKLEDRIETHIQIEHQLINRIVGFYLLELLYGIVQVSEMEEIARKVSDKLDRKEGTGQQLLLQRLSRICFIATQDTFLVNNTIINELFQKYQCCAYRALCTIVMNTKTELKFYNQLVFTNYIWARIIGTSEDLFQSDLVVDFVDFPRVRQRIVSMKGDATTIDGNANFQTLNSVFSSSLSQDVTRIDFTNRILNASAMRAATTTNKAVVLEDLAMNNHELMPTLCAVVEHLFEKKITSSTTPDWIVLLANLMRNREVHRNIRLFVGRLVENCKEQLQEYASTLFGPVLHLIRDKCAGRTVNVYYIDMIQMVIKWNVQYTPSTADEKALVADAVKFLVEGCYNDNSDAMKFNLEIMRVAVTVWKEIISTTVPKIIPHQLMGHLAESAYCGLQIDAIFLINDLTPWTAHSKGDYLASIRDHLKSDTSGIYKTAAQVLGYFFALEGGDMTLIVDFLRHFLRDDKKKFVDILYGIHLQFPAIVEPFVETIFNNLPSAIKTVRIKFLTMLLVKPIPHREIIAMGMLDMLKQREYQLYILHIINKSVSEFSDKDKDSILDEILAIAKSGHSESRLIAYEILFKYYLATHSESSRKADVTYALVHGLKDPEDVVQSRLLKFWSEDANLPLELTNRFAKVIEIFGGVTNMDDFLEVNAQLLLALLIMNPNASRQIFPNESEYDNKLLEYEINVNWKSQNLSRTIPLFAKSIAGTFVPGQSQLSFKDATLNQGVQHFEPTLNMSAYPSSRTYSIPTQSSFLFDVQGTQLLNENSEMVLTQTQQAGAPINPLKKRLIRDKNKTAKNIAVQAMTKRGFEEQRKMYARRDRTGKVTIYRRYRYGDFPDFLINHLALLLPLQALAKRDQIVARKLFVGLFQSLTDSLSVSGRSSFCEKVGSSLDVALKDVRYCNSNVYGSFMELSFHCPRTLPMNVTVNISIHNNTPALAALVFENKITHYDAGEHGTVAKRKTGGARTEEHALWMKVAELYKATKDSEVVSGIFADKLDSDAKLIEAIGLESSGKFGEAQKIYYTIINSVQRLEMDYCYEALFNCYLEMGKWGESVQEVTRQMGDWDQLWTVEWNEENLLPNMIHSQLKMILDEENKSNSPFMGRLDTWMNDKDRQRVLKLDFPEELVMFNMIAKNHLAARVLTEENIWSFASEWGHLSVLSENVRRQRLLDIRIIAEIDSYLEILTRQAPVDDQLKSMLASIVKRWSNSEPRKSDSLLMWDFLFSCRRFIGNQLFDKDPIELQSVYFHMYNRVFNLAVNQQNVTFAGKLLAKMVVLKEKSQQPVLKLKCKMARVNNQILKAELRADKKATKLATEALLDIVKMDKEYLQMDTEYQLPTVLETVDLIERAHQMIQIGDVEREQARTIIKLIPGIPTDDLNDGIHKYIQKLLQDSIQMTEDFPQNFMSHRQVNAVRDTHLKLAQYSYDYLERNPHVDEMEKGELQEVIVTSLLDSLRYESDAGQKLFPSILRFKKEPHLKKLFVEKSSQVPVRLFLKWIPQLLSHLNFQKESYLDELLLRIAKEYPMALYFPFQLSYEQHKFQNPSQEDRATILGIKTAIYNPKMEMLVNGLSSVCLPNVMFSAQITNLLRTLKIQRGDFRASLERTISILKPDDALLRGRLYRSYRGFVQKLEDSLKFDVTDAQQEAKLRKTLEEMKKTLATSQYRSSTADLEDLCPWLATYSSVNGENIEIPGQYADLAGQNLPREPVKIMKFANKIDVFESKTRPVKITIYGSDGHQYAFLLKYGEDLRQDQRIQQTFKLMSDNLAMDKHCRSMKLNIVTYNVVPVNSYFGMLSWVPDTVPLKEFVSNSLTYNADNMKGVIESIQSEHHKFLRNHSDAASIWELYSDTVEKAAASQLKDKFLELSHKLPSDLLRQAIIEISSSPESFFMLRNNFCRTMAAMNIAHWIMGVGDRHLQNVLMNVKTCNLIGIDFNVVFESGFRVLPIPELIPFRMTPQFVNVMSPFGVTGVIKSAMIHSLRVFRSERKLLQTCLEVFLREPTIDWLYNAIFAQDEPAEFNTLSTDTRVHWDPSDRLAAVKDKLEGANPVAPILKGLRAGHLGSKLQVVEAYSNILQGTKDNIRHQMDKRGLNVDQQVQCLIDLATDPAVLGITFNGIFPWL